MEDIQKFSGIVNDVFNNVQLEGTAKGAMKVLSSWQKVLLSIKSYNPNEGQNLASHSRVVDLKKGVLLIEADHPGWIEMLQMRKKYILRGMQMNAPDADIRTLAFRLKGKRDCLYDFGESSAADSEEEMRRMEKKLLGEEKMIGKFNQNQNEQIKKKPLPPELASIFADLKKSMLTNSE